MCGIIGSVLMLALGTTLVLVCSIVGYVVIPDVIKNLIVDSVVLNENTTQFERFEEVPIPLRVSIFIFNISNVDEVLNGEVPVVTEVGPYIYNLYQTRNITKIDGDILTYNRTEYFEFDAEASYPYTEDDLVTIVNVPYHAISQIAEREFSELLPILSLALGGVFGQYNSPIIDVRMRELIFDGVPLCLNPGLIGSVACNIIRTIAVNAKNIELKEDGSMLFSVLGYKQGIPTAEYEVYRGLEDYNNLGHIRKYDALPQLRYWQKPSEEGEYPSNVCNMINGTDSGIYAPFIDIKSSLYALNTDICRSVELRYQYDIEISDIPTVRYSANEWFLDNDDGCFCLNVTAGINREDGCLLRGALELYTCIGGYLVLSYPHFLYADMLYRNGVLGLNSEEDAHRIFLDIEPQTGTPIQAAKRAQFNIFMRPVTGLATTQNLRTTLMPIFWIEEYFSLSDDLIDEMKSRLLRPLNLVRILLPVVIAISVVVMLIGLILTVRVVRAKMMKKISPKNISQ